MARRSPHHHDKLLESVVGLNRADDLSGNSSIKHVYLLFDKNPCQVSIFNVEATAVLLDPSGLLDHTLCQEEGELLLFTARQNLDPFGLPTY